MKKIAILGLGNFGYALLKHFDVKNHGQYSITAWDRDESIIRSLTETHRHPFLFQAVEISQNIVFSNNLGDVSDSNYIIFAIASSAYSHVLKNLKTSIPDNCIIINTAKALNFDGKRFSTVTNKILGNKPYSYAVLAGGTIAADLFRAEPLGIDIACKNAELHQDLTNLFNSYNLSAYPTDDVAGVEYASAFKNIVSILAGIIRGMGYSYGSETHVISRAADEIEHIVVTQLGGKRETFATGSQCWGNDLWMSCTGNTRNKQFGILIGQGLSTGEAMQKMEEEGKTVEGINTVRVLPQLADLTHYPLLSYLNEFFNNHGNLRLIEKIIFNHNL